MHHVHADRFFFFFVVVFSAVHHVDYISCTYLKKKKTVKMEHCIFFLVYLEQRRREGQLFLCTGLASFFFFVRISGRFVRLSEREKKRKGEGRGGKKK